MPYFTFDGNFIGVWHGLIDSRETELTIFVIVRNKSPGSVLFNQPAGQNVSA